MMAFVLTIAAYLTTLLRFTTAFGPPGRLDSRGVSKGDTNVSVVLSKVSPGFSLQRNLGTPTNAAETFLRLTLAPEGSGRTATLVNAQEDVNRQLYQFEYTVDRGERGPLLRAISLIAVRNGDDLLTLTVVAPQEEWEVPSEDAKLRKVASSFHLT
jgi:photosystem II oxygen-evolving enhancer protein 2